LPRTESTGVTPVWGAVVSEGAGCGVAGAGGAADTGAMGPASSGGSVGSALGVREGVGAIVGSRGAGTTTWTASDCGDIGGSGDAKPVSDEIPSTIQAPTNAPPVIASARAMAARSPPVSTAGDVLLRAAARVSGTGAVGCTALLGGRAAVLRGTGRRAHDSKVLRNRHPRIRRNLRNP